MYEFEDGICILGGKVGQIVFDAGVGEVDGCFVSRCDEEERVEDFPRFVDGVFLFDVEHDDEIIEQGGVGLPVVFWIEFVDVSWESRFDSDVPLGDG